MKQTGNESKKSPNRSPYAFGMVVVLGLLFFFLWTEHRAHLLGVLPLLLLFLLCPLMHFFMHRGHKKGHGHHDDADQVETDQEKRRLP